MSTLEPAGGSLEVELAHLASRVGRKRLLVPQIVDEGRLKTKLPDRVAGWVELYVAA